MTSSETVRAVRRRSASTADVALMNARRTSTPVRSSSSDTAIALVASPDAARGATRSASVARGSVGVPRRTSSSNCANSCGIELRADSRRMISIASRCENGRL